MLVSMRAWRAGKKCKEQRVMEKEGGGGREGDFGSSGREVFSEVPFAVTIISSPSIAVQINPIYHHQCSNHILPPLPCHTIQHGPSPTQSDKGRYPRMFPQRHRNPFILLQAVAIVWFRRLDFD